MEWEVKKMIASRNMQEGRRVSKIAKKLKTAGLLRESKDYFKALNEASNEVFNTSKVYKKIQKLEKFGYKPKDIELILK